MKMVLSTCVRKAMDPSTEEEPTIQEQKTNCILPERINALGADWAFSLLRPSIPCV